MSLDWETDPYFPLSPALRDEPMQWWRAMFILVGTRISDGVSVTQIVDIGMWWDSVDYRRQIGHALNKSGFGIHSGSTWHGSPMRTPGSDHRIAEAAAAVKDHTIRELLFPPSIR